MEFVISVCCFDAYLAIMIIISGWPVLTIVYTGLLVHRVNAFHSGYLIGA